MDNNYLLHNETAKKLYFEYAKDLPIIALCSNFEPRERIYNNITEAFLLNDFYKLDAMRNGDIDEKYITGDASDYEKFKAFCSTLPQFAGNPIYLLSHIELIKNYGCDLEINENNCDNIWSMCNAFIQDNQINDINLLERLNVTVHQCIDLDFFINRLLSRMQVSTLESFEKVIIDEIISADKKGCKNAFYSFGHGFCMTNPYLAAKIYKSYIENDEQIKVSDFNVLATQIDRSLGIVCKKLGWSWLYENYEPSPELINYLKKNNALPKANRVYRYNVYIEEEEFSSDILYLAQQKCFGKAILVHDTDNYLSTYARNDYFRRVVCNIVGEWVENGEYTSDEKILKKLIEDVLYNNLKEAIS